MPEAKWDDYELAGMSDYARKLAVSDPFRELAIGQAIAALRLPAGSRGLDVGCGIGLNTVRLAEATGPSGHVTGLDVSSELLRYARQLAERTSLSPRTQFVNGDANRLPFDERSFDWAWSSDCVAYNPDLRMEAIREMARVVRRSGVVAIVIYSSQLLLPGYPELEARLNATSAGIAPFKKGVKPELHYLRALGWLRAAGLTDVRADTFAQTFQAPLSKPVREALICLFGMRWPGVRSGLDASDWELFEFLSEPQSKGFILDSPDYYGFFTYSVFRGTVAGY